MFYVSSLLLDLSFKAGIDQDLVWAGLCGPAHPHFNVWWVLAVE